MRTRWLVQLQRFVLVGEVGTTYLLPAILINVGNAAAYLFQLLLGRWLDIAAFGAFNATFSLLLILTAPANFLPLIVAEATMEARSPGEAKRLLALFAGGAMLLAACLAALGLVFTALYGRRFDLDRAVAAAGLATVVFSCLHPVAVGMIQARRRYVRAALVIGGNPLLRFAFGLLLVAALGLGTGGAMWAVALPVGATFLLGLFFLRDLAGAASLPLGGPVRAVLARAGWRQALSVTLLTVISNMDVVLARIVLPQEAAGLYAGAAVVSRIGLLLPSALATIIFTEAARARAGSEATKVLHGLLVTGALSGALAVLFLVGGDWIMHLMLGRDFEGAGGILRMSGVAMCLFAVTQAGIMVLAGQGRFAYLGTLAVVGAAAAGFSILLPLTAERLALLMLATNAILLIFTIATFVRGRSPADAGPGTER